MRFSKFQNDLVGRFAECFALRKRVFIGPGEETHREKKAWMYKAVVQQTLQASRRYMRHSELHSELFKFVAR